MQEFHKTARNIFSTCFQSPIGFPKQMDNSVEMTVALKLGVQKSNIVDTSNIGCVWHELCMVYCWNKEASGLSRVPNCHHYHYLNRYIAQLSNSGDSDVQQTGLAQKDLPVVVLFTMALIAIRDFHRVSLKKIGETINSCIDDLEIKTHTLKGDMFMHFLRERVFEACL